MTSANVRRESRFEQRTLPALLGMATAVGAALAPGPAMAQEFRLHLEPAAALWVDLPQADRFTPGFSFAVRPGVALGRAVSLQWTYSALFTPESDSTAAAAGGEASDGETSFSGGTAHSVLAGLRVRPFAALQPDDHQLGGPFADFNIGYVRTGTLDRLGLDVGLGWGLQAASWLSIGPVVRYNQIVQPDRLLAFDPNDAQFVTIGLDFGLGPKHKESAALVCPDAPECTREHVQPSTTASMRVEEEPGCRDYDRDGVCDDDDKCPTQIGPPASLGCPIDPCSGAPLIVLVQFPYDSAELPPPREDDPQTMDPVLNAVAEAIAQDPTCRVCIVGHASEEGAVGYNLDLSNRRATAVERYLNARGLADSRMPTTGLGARCQLVPEASRPLNRRVEFHRLQDGESCPTDCSK